MTKRMSLMALGLECLLPPIEIPELCRIELFIFLYGMMFGETTSLCHYWLCHVSRGL